MPNEDRKELAELINVNTINRRLKGWVDNFQANLEHLKGAYGIASLIGSLPNVPVILVGSGPTLDRNIEELQGLENRALIITACSALAALQKHGIHPHISIMSDSLENNSRCLDGVDVENYNFVIDSFVHPNSVDILAKRAKRLYWYNTPDIDGCPFTGVLPQWTGYIGVLASGGCGATAAWSLGVSVCGCNPNVLVGMPEAFYDPQKQYAQVVTETHAVTPYTTEVEIHTDPWGWRCYTNKAYRSFALWFHDAFSRIPGTHVNCSEGGIIKEGCLIMPLEECKRRFLTAQYADIEGVLFAKEKRAAAYTQHVEADLSHLKSLLTILVDSPSIPNLALRMGWTHAEVAQTVIDLRKLGVNISEKATRWQPVDGPEQQTLIYTLESPKQNG